MGMVISNKTPKSEAEEFDQIILREFWNLGWDAYWKGINQDGCPTLCVKSGPESRYEWMLGWLTAKSADESDI